MSRILVLSLEAEADKSADGYRAVWGCNNGMISGQKDELKRKQNGASMGGGTWEETDP